MSAQYTGEAIILDAHLPSPSARFLILSDLLFGASVYQITYLRPATTEDHAKGSDCAPPLDELEIEEQRNQLLAKLKSAYEFMSRFEGDELQGEIDARLPRIRSAIARAKREVAAGPPSSAPTWTHTSSGGSALAELLNISPPHAIAIRLVNDQGVYDIGAFIRDPVPFIPNCANLLRFWHAMDCFDDVLW